jgi:hypothetical protein
MSIGSRIRQSLIVFLTTESEIVSESVSERVSERESKEQHPDTVGGDWCSRPNKYDAVCHVCGEWVPAGEGRFRPYGAGHAESVCKVFCPDCRRDENALRGIERVSFESALAGVEARIADMTLITKPL